MAAGASDGGSGGRNPLPSQYLVVVIVLLSMIVGGGLVFLLLSDGGDPKPKVISESPNKPNNPPQPGNGGRGNPNPPAPAAPVDPVKAAIDARLAQLDKQVAAKTQQATQQAVNDLKNWIEQEPRYAAAVLSETYTSKNIVPRLVKDCKAYQQTIDLIDAATAALANSGSFSGIVGGIGLGTYETQAEFRNIKVEKAGSVLYSSNFASNADGWKPESGNWSVAGGAYRLGASGIFTSYLPNDSWSDYTLTLQARKITGKEGFMIVFGKNTKQKFAWNLGGYTNKFHAIEYNGQMLDHSVVGAQVPGSIDENRWYDLKIQTAGSKIACYLDGKLIHQIDITPATLNGSILQGMRHWKAVALNESGKPDEAADLVKVNFQNGWTNTSKTMTDIVTSMVNKKANNAVLTATQGIILGCPQDSDTVEKAINQRITTLRAMQRFDEALAEAKTLFNYSTMERTSDALKTLDRELSQVSGNNRAKLDLFHDEQTKGVSVQANGQPNKSTVVAGIRVDGLTYVMQIQTLSGSDYPTLIKKGALLLLSDKGDQAEATFKQALEAAYSLSDKQAVRSWIARSIKAQDGTIGRANYWVTISGK